MAIKKTTIASNGIVMEYHRIAMIKIDTNQQNTILVHSYLSEAGRQVEKDYASGLYDNIEEGLMNWPYVATRYLNCDYDGMMTITKAYEYVKSLPEFDGAIDV